MTIRDQVNTLKDNWLLVAIVVVLLGFLFVGSSSFGSISQSVGYSKGYAGDMMMESAMAPAGYNRGYNDGDFAPEVEERQVIKTGNLDTEVQRGTFDSADSKLKSIADASDSFILSENVRKSGTDRKSYMTGSYQIKIDVTKYDSVIAQLKDIGEVQSFNENAQDVTGRYTDLNVELEAEQQRLARYESMYSQATEVNDKLELSDRIFNQERRIKYLKNSIENIDKKVEYSTVRVSINEKRSDYFDIQFVKFSQLIRDIVGSFNSLLHLIFLVIPYAIAVLVIWVGYKFVKNRRN